MRRLRAVAAILFLAVIWLGFQVAHEIAAERARTSQQSAVDPVPPSARAKQRTKSRAAAEVEGPKAPLPKTFAQHTSGEALAPPQVAVPAVTPESPAAAQPVILPVPPKDVPFFQSAFLDAQAGILPGAGAGRRRGGVPSMSGGGGGGGIGGGMSGAAPAKNDDTTGSGTGSPSVLGRRFSSETEESGTGGDSNNTGGNSGSGGSGGSGGDGGSNSSNSDSSAKDSNQGGSNEGGSNQGGTNQGGTNQGGNNQGGNNQGGNNQGGNNQGGNNQGGSNEGGSNSSGAPGDTGKSGEPGGSGGDGGEQAIQAALAPTVDGPNDGPKDLRSVPEPGSILLALGAAAAIVRRRMR